MLPDDGPKGPKHVGAIQRDTLNTNCSILCSDKKCICWQNSLVKLLILPRFSARHGMFQPTWLSSGYT